MTHTSVLYTIRKSGISKHLFGRHMVRHILICVIDFSACHSYKIPDQVTNTQQPYDKQDDSKYSPGTPDFPGRIQFHNNDESIDDQWIVKRFQSPLEVQVANSKSNIAEGLNFHVHGYIRL